MTKETCALKMIFAIGRVIAPLALWAVVAPVSAQLYQQDDLDRLEGTLARVKPGIRAYFETGNWQRGCKSERPEECRRKTYVLGGDIVLVGAVRGAKVRAAYTNGTRMTLDWLPRATLVAIPTPATTLTSWRGEWLRDDETGIKIKTGKRPHSLAIEGEAAGKRSPYHLGSFGGQGRPVRDRIDFADGDDICHVKMRLVGPYLVVADNQQCGGINVSFSGIYRQAKTSRRQSGRGTKMRRAA